MLGEMEVKRRKRNKKKPIIQLTIIKRSKYVLQESKRKMRSLNRSSLRN